MSDISLEINKSGINKAELSSIQNSLKEACFKIKNKTGAGNDMLGWVDLPVNYDKEEFFRIKSAAEKIRENSDAFIVIGIGGSYLGARAVIEALMPDLFNNLSKEKRRCPEIYFAGHNVSESYLNNLIELVREKDISINVISKSGTTTEPAIAFRLFKNLIEDKYGKDHAKERIYITTDAKKGALKEMAEQEGYETFTIPDNIGGRYSVLTAVGLLPIAVANIEIEELIKGAAEARSKYSEDSPDKNDICSYVAMRNILYQKGKKIEIMVNYDPRMHYFTEWWKQLFGESEGKDGKGIFPASIDLTTDLHSMGQYIQDSERHLFETVLFIEKSENELQIPHDQNNIDGLNFLAGKSVKYVNEKAMIATAMAHTDGGVPNLIIRIPELNAYYLGQLIYFFEKACAISGYILGVNPFDQPGVEAYKNNMFVLLGKPGYEEHRGGIKKTIEA